MATRTGSGPSMPCPTCRSGARASASSAAWLEAGGHASRTTARLSGSAWIPEDMSLDYAAEHLEGAVRSLATGEAPLAERLQRAWQVEVQMLWMKPCLTYDL